MKNAVKNICVLAAYIIAAGILLRFFIIMDNLRNGVPLVEIQEPNKQKALLETVAIAYALVVGGTWGLHKAAHIVHGAIHKTVNGEKPPTKMVHMIETSGSETTKRWNYLPPDKRNRGYKPPIDTPLVSAVRNLDHVIQRYRLKEGDEQ